MSFNDVPDQQLQSETQVLRKLKDALASQTPFSLIRIGDAENIVLAQEKLLSDKALLKTFWVKRARKKPDQVKGITLPCYLLRDQVLEAIPKADLVGICRHKQKLGDAPLEFCRPLTNQIFDLYRLQPRELCDVWINRQLVAHQSFWELLRDYRVVLISKWAGAYSEYIAGEYADCGINLAGCLDFTRFEQIEATLDSLKEYQFDLALVSAGVNAVILATQIADRYGKVALDFGKTMQFMLQERQKLVDPWKPTKTVLKDDSQ